MDRYTIGNQEQSWVMPGAFRGNLFTAQRAVTLDRFEMFLEPQGVCELRFMVCSALPGERFTVEWATTQKAKPEAAFYASGPIALPTVAGRLYSVGIGWTGSCRYFSGQYGAFDGADAGLGPLSGSLFDNDHSPYRRPPQDIGPTPSACYHQHIWVRP